MACSQGPCSCTFLDHPVAFTIVVFNICPLRRSGLQTCCLRPKLPATLKPAHGLPPSAIGSSSESRCTHVLQSCDIGFYALRLGGSFEIQRPRQLSALLGHRTNHVDTASWPTHFNDRSYFY